MRINDSQWEGSLFGSTLKKPQDKSTTKCSCDDAKFILGGPMSGDTFDYHFHILNTFH